MDRADPITDEFLRPWRRYWLLLALAAPVMAGCFWFIWYAFDPITGRMGNQREPIQQVEPIPKDDHVPPNPFRSTTPPRTGPSGR